MYKESEKHIMIESDFNIEKLLHKRGLKRYNSLDRWHNQFLENVVNQVDESVFKPLFNEKMGAPNIPIRQLIGISILKEGFGCSDEHMFEQVQFHLLVRKALGINTMDDPGPSLDVYYCFRRRIVEYEFETGIDLYKLCFEAITKSQVLKFKVNGKNIRMDSKLIGSNIAWYSRFEIIHETILACVKDLSVKQLHCLKKEDRVTYQTLMEQPAQQLVYTETASSIEKRLQAFGYLIYALLFHFGENLADYKLLKRVFDEQFVVDKKRVTPRDKKEISAQSVQNPHDPQATYRCKEDQKVKGYSTNIAETCNKIGLNLITDAQVKNVSAADKDFLQPAIIQSQENVLDQQVEEVHVDGAYNSADNREFAEKNGINLYLTGMQGKLPRYTLTETEDGLQVTDIQTGITVLALQIKPEKWRIKTEKAYRYFTPKDIEASALRKQLKEIPIELKKQRNNVEATIFQFCFHTRNNKTKYRGLIKHKLFAFARCLWINHVRIAIFELKTAQKALINGILKSILILKNFLAIIFPKNQISDYYLLRWI